MNDQGEGMLLLQCSYTNVNKNELAGHEVRHHSHLRPFHCLLCGDLFTVSFQE